MGRAFLDAAAVVKQAAAPWVQGTVRHVDARGILVQCTDPPTHPFDRFTRFAASDAALALAGEHPECGTATPRQLLASGAVGDLGLLAQGLGR